MTSTVCKALVGVATLTLAATSLSAPGFAKDGNQSKRNTSQTFQFVAPKATKTGGSRQVFTSQFVAPKAPRTGSGPSGDGVTTAKFVAPKAPREDAPVVASLGTPKPLLLAPVTTSPAAAVQTGAAAETSTAVAEPAPATDTQVILAYLRAAQHYGYGDAPAYGQSDDYSAYDGEDDSDDNCE